MNKVVIAGSIVLGVAFLGLACLYFVTPAHALPSFVPGYASGLMKKHYTHGLGALIVSLCFFVFSWFQTGKKSTK